MRLKFLKQTIITGLMIMGGNVYTQFSGNNLFEVQWGNLPDDEPAMLLSNYNQLNLNYRHGDFKASGRLEYFINRFAERRYLNPSQFRLGYKTRTLEFKAGTYYDMLGNGLLLRAYDIPGSVFESPGYRIRHGFYRDLFGGSAGYRGENFRIRTLYGKPLVNVLPPGVDRKERRSEDLYALQPGFTIGEQDIDLHYLYTSNKGGSHHYSSVKAAGNLPYNFSYNIEVAAELGTGMPLFTESGSTHAVYASLMYSGWSTGGSLEWKDYRNFILGSGFNDPPTLVKEHTYKVLNRSIHVPLISNERGFQAEFYYRFESGHTLTLNVSRARNESVRKTVWQEYFAEVLIPFGGSSTLKWFTDYAMDPFRYEPHRVAGGGIAEVALAGKWSMMTELEYQFIRRTGFLPGSVHNAVIIVGLSKGPAFSIALTYEGSTDPFLTDDPGTFEIEKGSRHWLGLDMKLKIRSQHTLALFAGQRRGGPACTSGICYEVLDFTGLELRLISKF
jgi:hypothetical protein